MVKRRAFSYAPMRQYGRVSVERGARGVRGRERVPVVYPRSTLAGSNFINVTDYGVATTDTQASSAENKAGMDRAIAAAISTGRGIYFPAGTYWLSRAAIIESATRLHMFSDCSAVIKYPSADSTLTGSATYDSTAAFERSAFYVRNSTDIWFDGIVFQGSDTETNYTINQGVGVAAYNTSGLRITNCTNLYGASLVWQSSQTNDFGAVVEGCRVYGGRVNSRLGDGGSFIGCTFELPTTASYDRVGDNGSSHAIYHFSSSGDYLRVIGCTFKNIRQDGVKFSGSTSSLTGLVVDGCTFINCGKKSDGTSNSGICVVFGADDVQTHAACTIVNNQFIDCGQAVQIYGSRSTTIANNNIYTSTAPSFVSTCHMGVTRSGASTQEVEAVQICSNTITAPPTIGGGSIATSAISISGAGVTSTSSASSTYHSSIDVRGNTLAFCAGAGISSTRSVCPSIEDNKIIGIATGVSLSGDRMPLVRNNHFVNQQSSNAQIRMTYVSWPLITGNVGSGKVGAYQGKPTIGNNAGGGTVTQFPLLGFSGYCTTTDSKPELVFAYGDGWTSGDTIDFNGTTLTYVTGTPGANQFNSFSTLLTAINALGGGTTYMAADYGDRWSVTTYHAWVRRQSTSTTANLFYMKATTKSPCACVLLVNYSLLGDRTFSRGENANYAVVWSPYARLESPPILTPENAAAQAALDASTPLRVTSEAGDDRACSTLSIAGLAGTEQFTWRT